MTTFSTMGDAAEYVTTALGCEFADDYDVDAIAKEICEWRNGKLTLILDDDCELFWQIVSKHDMSMEV